MGCLEFVLLEGRALPKRGLNEGLSKGKIMGRLVVTTEVKASRVPHSPASWAPWIGSWRRGKVSSIIVREKQSRVMKHGKDLRR